MFRHPAWAVGSYSSGPPAAVTVGSKLTGGCYRGDVSPCSLYYMSVHVGAVLAVGGGSWVRVLVGGGGAVDIHAAGDQPARAEDRPHAVVHLPIIETAIW